MTAHELEIYVFICSRASIVQLVVCIYSLMPVPLLPKFLNVIYSSNSSNDFLSETEWMNAYSC